MQEAVLHYMPFRLKMARARTDCAEAARSKAARRRWSPSGDARATGAPAPRAGADSADRHAGCFGPVPGAASQQSRRARGMKISAFALETDELGLIDISLLAKSDKTC